MPSHAKGVRKTFLKVFDEAGVRVIEDGVRAVETLVLQSGREINADECIWCTQAGAAKWLKESTDLALDDDGFIAVNATLESASPSASSRREAWPTCSSIRDRRLGFSPCDKGLL